MTVTHLISFTFSGIEAVPVDVQVQISSGLPAFLIVGLPDKTVSEARERVREALTSMGLSLPPKRIVVNMAPANLIKDGSHFDVPIALAILSAMQILSNEELQEFAAIGELSLEGKLLPVEGVLSAALGASGLSLGLICPATQASEAVWAGNIAIIGAEDLLSLVNHFRGLQILEPPGAPNFIPPPIEHDLKDIKGIETGRRALEIAACGGHSMLMIGPPGAGKSMLAARMPSILPDLNGETALEVSRIHSMAGLLAKGQPLIRPPFRSPHHSASLAALVGGGHRSRPGEISLAHRGVLFMDEFPEFSRSALEALRQPMEAGKISIARVAQHITYPAKFQLLAAMNPCRCGTSGLRGDVCVRGPKCGQDYVRKISGPLLDRIDIVINIYPVKPEDLLSLTTSENSAIVAERVKKCHDFQSRRQIGLNKDGTPNPSLFTSAALTLAKSAAEKTYLSARGFSRLLRVARTISDLESCDLVQKEHILEALTYRHKPQWIN